MTLVSETKPATLGNITYLREIEGKPDDWDIVTDRSEATHFMGPSGNVFSLAPSVPVVDQPQVHYLRETSPRKYISSNRSGATHVMASDGKIIALAHPQSNVTQFPPRPSTTTAVAKPPDKITEADSERLDKAMDALEYALRIAREEGAWKQAWVISNIIKISDYPMKSIYRSTAMGFAHVVEGACELADDEGITDVNWISLFTSQLISDCYKRGMTPNWLYKEDPAGVLFDKPTKGVER